MRVTHIGALASIGSAASVNALVHPRLIYQFPNATFIENIAVRPNGHLVLNTFDDGRIYTIDPCAHNPTPKLLAKVPGVTGVTGIAHIAPDVYAITGGLHDIPNYTWQAGSAQVFKLDLNNLQCAGKPLLTHVVSMPLAHILNGMTSLPSQPHVILSVDSKTGDLWRINIDTGSVELAFHSDELGVSDDGIVPLGANGIHIYGDYLYLTNSARGYFGRVKIDKSGAQVGHIEVISRPVTGAPGSTVDDFVRIPDGSFYVALEPDSLVKVSPDGKNTLLLDGSSDILLAVPTSVALSNDKTKAYVITSGGQIVEIAVYL